MSMKNIICINLNKIIKITELITNFVDDERQNIAQFLIDISDICNYDNIAYIQNETLIDKFDIISPSKEFVDILYNDSIYKNILYKSKKLQFPAIINDKDQIHPKYNVHGFDILVPVLLQNFCIGTIIVSYTKDSLNYQSYSSIDLSHYQLIASIISLQENSYRIKTIMKQSNVYGKILNELSQQLIDNDNSNMDSFIDDCIQRTCENWKIDKGYLFVADFDEKKLHKTNEWCIEGIDSVLQTEPEMDINTFPWNHILYSFNNDNESQPIHIPDMENRIEIMTRSKIISEEDIIGIEMIKRKNIKSILLIPVLDNYKDKKFTVAILGFSQVLNLKIFSQSMVDLLKILSCYISEAIKRRREFQNTTNINKVMFSKLQEWKKENIENNIIFNSLQDKMKNVFDDHKRRDLIANE